MTPVVYVLICTPPQSRYISYNVYSLTLFVLPPCPHSTDPPSRNIFLGGVRFILTASPYPGTRPRRRSWYILSHQLRVPNLTLGTQKDVWYLPYMAAVVHGSKLPSRHHASCVNFEPVIFYDVHRGSLKQRLFTSSERAGQDFTKVRYPCCHLHPFTNIAKTHSLAQ